MCSEAVNQYDALGNLVTGFDYEIQVFVINGICDYIGIGGFYAGFPITQIRKELGLPVPSKWPPPSMKPRLAYSTYHGINRRPLRPLAYL